MSKFKMEGKDWDKIINYARVAYNEDKSEIGGMMIASKNDEGNFLLSNPVILKQQVSGSNTILDKEALAKYYAKTAINNAEKDIIFVWWHSHHTMSAFWSHTDLATIDTTKTGSVSMSLVVNIKEEYLFRVNIWQPIEAYQELSIDILKPEKAIPKSIVKEYKKLCSDIPLQITTFNRKSTNTHSRIIPQTKYNGYYNEPNILDQEYVNLEARLDDLLTDYYCETIKYHKFKKTISKLNDELESRRSELRIRPIEKDVLDAVVHSSLHNSSTTAQMITCVQPSKQTSLWGDF